MGGARIRGKSWKVNMSISPGQASVKNVTSVITFSSFVSEVSCMNFNHCASVTVTGTAFNPLHTFTTVVDSYFKNNQQIVSSSDSLLRHFIGNSSAFISASLSQQSWSSFTVDLCLLACPTSISSDGRVDIAWFPITSHAFSTLYGPDKGTSINPQLIIQQHTANDGDGGSCGTGESGTVHGHRLWPSCTY